MDDATDWHLVTSRLRAETFVRHVEYHEEIGSTNDRGIELAADASRPTPLLVLAARQTAGRGRGAKAWLSGPGSLTFSLVVDRPEGLPRERLPTLSLAAGLAARSAVAAAASGHLVQVKWPNDVYLDGRKVCGILTEVPSAFPDRAVIGVGINASNSLADAPEDVRPRIITLAEATGQRCDVGHLLVDLLVRLAAERRELGDAGGLSLARWSPHCLLTGRAVRLRIAAGEVAGRCTGVAEDGALLLEHAGTVRPFHSGEVVAF